MKIIISNKHFLKKKMTSNSSKNLRFPKKNDDFSKWEISSKFSSVCTRLEIFPLFFRFHSSLIALNVAKRHLTADLHLTFTTSEKCWTFFFPLHLTLLFSHQSHAIYSMKKLRNTFKNYLIV